MATVLGTIIISFCVFCIFQIIDDDNSDDEQEIGNDD